jgi:hypothetical protein
MLAELRAENRLLRGIIARNAMQRMREDDADVLYVTAEDIRISVDILHQWQAEQAAEANQVQLVLDSAQDAALETPAENPPTKPITIPAGIC